MKVVETYGIDELAERFDERFVFELPEKLRCGKPVAFEMQTLRLVETFAVGVGWIIEGKRDPDGGKKGITPEEYRQMLELCSKAITRVREWDKLEDGSLVERWTPVRVVIGREPDAKAEPKEISARMIDFNTTLSDMTAELVRRFQLQWSARGNGGGPVREEGLSGSGGPVQDVAGDAAPRVGAQRARRARP